MYITFFAPTVFEISPLLNYLNEHFESQGKFFIKKDLKVKVNVCGVGLTNTAIDSCIEFHHQKPDIAILVGVCGAYKKDLALGTVVNVIEESFGDLGIEQANGDFTSMHELGLLEANEFPFKDSKLRNPSNEFGFLKRVSAVSLNTSSGNQENIDKRTARHNADIENMEGAAFFQVCLQMGINFLQIRAVSNLVESRNIDNWELSLAITNLNDTLVEMLGSIV